MSNLMRFTPVSDADADSLTISVGLASMPEPPSWVIGATGILGLAAYRRRMAESANVVPA